jgi:hypothetical protein
VESYNGETTIRLPTVMECDNVPDIRNEIPHPEVAKAYPHLRDIADYIPPLCDKADILLLIGRDLPDAHHVLDQCTGGPGDPFGQKLHLGWVVIGETCLGGVHISNVVNVSKTQMLRDGRPTVMTPCPNDLQLTFEKGDDFGNTVFQKTSSDEQFGPSVEDQEFLRIMDSEFRKDEGGMNWVAPLPFRPNRPRLPNNYSQASRRAKSLDNSLLRDPKKREHMMDFMKGVIDNGHAELAPQLTEHEECWYLPLLGVYNAKKPDQIRGVFDSSATYENVSLNKVLLGGPDLTNSLLGILLRFREEKVAITADIQQMFYAFKVEERHRNFLRFFGTKTTALGKSL